MRFSSGNTRLWPWFVVLLPAMLVIAIRWNASPGRDVEDYAHYVLHARNIVAGRPYADVGCLRSQYSPRCSPQPPGLPLTLAALYATVGERPVPTALLMLAITLGFALVAGAYFKRQDPQLGLGVVLLTLLASGVLEFATHVQSDLPFALCLWAAIALADRPGQWSWPRIVAIVALSLAALSYRVLGVALVPAFLAVAVVRRRELGWRGLVPMLCLTAALGAALVARGLPTQASELLADGITIARSLLPLRLGLSHALLYPFPWDLANDGYHVVAMLVTALGLALWVRAGGWRTLAFSFAVWYLAILLLLPFGVSRYFWPLTPLVVFGLLRGLAFLAAALPRLRAAAEPSAVALGIAVLIGIGAAANALAKPRPGWLRDDPDTHALFATLKAFSDSGAVRPAFFKPRVLTLETGLSATPTFKAPPVEARRVLGRLCITHVVIGSDGQAPNADQAFRNLVQAYPDEFTLVYGNPGYQVYRFDGLDCPQLRDPAPAGGSG